MDYADYNDVRVFTNREDAEDFAHFLNMCGNDYLIDTDDFLGVTNVYYNS